MSKKHAHNPKNPKTKPAPPKKPLTGFFIYKQDVYEQTRKENPDAKMTELTVIISDKWKNIDSETKNIYEKKASDAQDKYEAELREYEDKYGKIKKVKRKCNMEKKINPNKKTRSGKRKR